MQIFAKSNLRDDSVGTLLFKTMMADNFDIASSAVRMGIESNTLRQFIENRTTRPRSKTLVAIAERLGIKSNELQALILNKPKRRERFDVWLNAQLTSGNVFPMPDGPPERDKKLIGLIARRSGIGSQSLCNYLLGLTLPDTDQAMRLADVLMPGDVVAAITEMAEVVVSDMVIRAGGELRGEPQTEGEAEVLVLQSETEDEAPVLGGTSGSPSDDKAQDIFEQTITLTANLLSSDKLPIRLPVANAAFIAKMLPLVKQLTPESRQDWFCSIVELFILANGGG
jgi:hypothetical protein